MPLPLPPPPPPPDKKAFIGLVGEKLVERRGKKKYYTRTEIDEVVGVILEGVVTSADWSSWAYSIFTDRQTFNAIRKKSGATGDYDAMRSEVLTELSANDSFLPIDLDLSWLEWPDIDLGDIFSGIDF